MELVYDSAIRSKLAYLEPEELKKSIPEAEFITSSGDEDAQAYFWRVGDTVYVTFRGTSSIKDASIDLTLSRYRIKNKVRVHEGFYTQFKSIEIEITKRLVHHSDASKIIFAGHSLGGALAQIAAAYYGEIFDYSFVACHTFGSPRVGNTHFVEWFSKHVDENVRVSNRFDPVPMVPTMHYWTHTTNKCIMLYPDGKHEVKEKDVPWYQRGFRLLRSATNVSAHSCNEYVRLLKDLV